MSAFWMTSKDTIWDVREVPRNTTITFPLMRDGKVRSDPSAFKRISKGDVIYCYFTDGKRRGIASVFKCAEPFKARGRGGAYKAKKVRDLPTMVSWEEICKDPIMKKSRVVRMQASGSLFTLTTTEAAALKRLVAKADAKPVRKYWMYTPGSSARGSWDFDADIEDGVMGLGQDALGDLRKYGHAIKRLACDMRKHYNVKDGTGNARYMMAFRDEMQMGDVVFVKRGKNFLQVLV